MSSTLAVINRAMALLANGRVAEAEQMCLEAAKSPGAQSGVMELVTNKALGRADYKRCEELARLGIKKFPDSYLLHLALVRAMIYQHRVAEATERLFEMTRRFSLTDVVAWELSTILTWQGRWEEAVKWQGLARQLNTSLPDYSEVHCYMTDAVRRAESLPVLPWPGEVTIFSLPVWGDAFLEAFLGYGLPSILHESNLPVLAEKTRPVFRLYSNPSGLAELERAPGVAALRGLAQVELELIPQPLFTWNGSLVTGWLHHLSLHEAQARQADCCLLYAEGIFSQGSLAYLASMVAGGHYDAVVSQGINLSGEGRARTRSFLDPRSQTLGMASRDLVDLAMEHLSQRYQDYLAPGADGLYSADPSNFIYSDGQVLRMRTLQPLPYYISHRVLRLGNQYNYCCADHGLLDALFPDPAQFGRIKWAGHSDEFLCVGVDWTPQDKRSFSSQRVDLAQLAARARDAFGSPARVWAFMHELVYQGRRQPGWRTGAATEQALDAVTQAVWSANELRPWKLRQGFLPGQAAVGPPASGLAAWDGPR